MKTIQRTMKYMVCLSLLLTVKQFASAEVGPGNGGGNGGNGFLMQELKAANPGLSPAEILLKAFNDSEGRVPKLFRVNNSNVFHFSAVRSTDDLQNVKANNLMINIGSQKIHKVAPFLLCSDLDLGPLLSDIEPNCRLNSVYPNYALTKNKTKITSSGLIVSDKNAGFERKVYEFRKLSEKEVVFVRYSSSKKNDIDICDDVRGEIANETYNAVNGICSVGYIWSK